MCGRFTLTQDDLGDVAAALEAEAAPEHVARHRARYNVAPTDVHPILRLGAEGRRRLVPGVWGFGAGDPGDRPPVINARSETAATRPMFREAFQRRRCLVPADGFLEWTGDPRRRRPIWFHRPDRGLILLAALFQERTDGPAFVILTTGASPDVAAVHDRMPVIVPGARAGDWLGGQGADLLGPAPAGLLAATEVSRRINSARNDDPACLEPAAPPAPAGGSRQGRLF